MGNNDKLDLLQERLVKIKFASLFKRICGAYNAPSSTQNLVNQGVAFKIAREYSPVDAYLQSERNQIVHELSQINFTIFFTHTKISTNKDKRIFFSLKTPKTFLSSKSSNPYNYIRYVLKKYCNILSSEKLSEIYNSTIPLNLTRTQAELKNAIYDIVSARATLINRMAAIFESKENKQDIKIALHLKELIERTKFKIQDNQISENNLEIMFSKSIASK